MKNRLVVIGWLGSRTCYLNHTREEAIAKYMIAYPYTPLETILSEYLINEYEFDDVFEAYDVWL